MLTSRQHLLYNEKNVSSKLLDNFWTSKPANSIEKIPTHLQQLLERKQPSVHAGLVDGRHPREFSTLSNNSAAHEDGVLDLRNIIVDGQSVQLVPSHPVSR
jgi:hypothetical protein